MSNTMVPGYRNGEAKIVPPFVPGSVVDPETDVVISEPPADDDSFEGQNWNPAATQAKVLGGALVAVLAVVLLVSFIEPAHAQAFGRIETILNNIVSTITGGVGRAIAIIAVMMVGLAWMFGQMDVKRAGAVIVGIGIVWGAAQIVSTMTGG
jgi:type IV secretion system protein VirB2